jgi:hypothetical protein
VSEKRWARWIGELAVIVLGVLVALGVDDLRQGMSDRRLELELLERVRADLVADAEDLGRAHRQVGLRLWVLEALTTEMPSDPDSTFERLSERPLRVFARNLPEFDLFDDTYQEMIATGTLDVVRDAVLRSEIVSYYRTARDKGDNARRAAPYQQRLEEALARIDVATVDEISLTELRSRVAADPTVHVAVRQALPYLRLQRLFFDQAGAARVELEQALARGR